MKLEMNTGEKKLSNTHLLQIKMKQRKLKEKLKKYKIKLRKSFKIE